MAPGSPTFIPEVEEGRPSPVSSRSEASALTELGGDSKRSGECKRYFHPFSGENTAHMP
ncbi:Hypothetical protein GbCGDNIH9_5012 [Granulibacter bethesdensis]|uniref:Uncharacterized protein n=1 Tax=Granulibacter bethesdensis TaxID=364410 RepID=A0AAC9K8R7_9PROT|nr:Hypothetical protein GbCGDNIH9_5012 [Granulibacter bethesdensis]APH61142.1 Hypothetical protein GbCGDNIH8_5012 [Granulibacter bethesdensis]